MAYTTIDDPSAYFQTALYTGNATNGKAITNDGNSDLQPDWVWIKRRDDGADHNCFDSSRGTGKHLAQNQTQAEQTVNGVTGFNSDGFTLSTNGDSNANNGTFVGWQWKANGGTTASNSNGSITSTVQANQDAGFSIVTYTGTGSAATVGHGLGVVPSVMIIKNREYAASWVVYHKDIHADPEEYGLRLNNDSARSSTAGFWNNTAPTSSVFTIGDNSGVNNGDNTDTLVAYCFAEKQGYSKFGSYLGNGSGTSDGTFDGVFVYLGFKPAWLMIKRTSYSAGDGWEMFDNTRPPRGGSTTGNYINNKLAAQSSAAESGNVYDAVDFLSNGFKARTGRAGINSGSTYTYYAFAENPFTTSTGIPTTAR